MLKNNRHFNDIIEKEITNRYLSGEKSTDLALEYSCVYSTILNIVKRQGGKSKSYSESHKKYTVDDMFFDEINNEETSYFLGLLYSDGCVHSTFPRFSLSLQIDDFDILETFKEKLKYTGDLYTRKYKNKNNKIQKVLSITSERLKTDLIKHGCTSKKSLILKFPEIDTNLMKHFIRGVFDGDGTINYGEKKDCSFDIVGSVDFVDGLYDYLKNNHIIDRVYTYYINGSKNKVLSIRCKKELYNMYKYLYKDSTIFLERKKKNYDNIINILNDKKNIYSDEKIEQYDKNNIHIKTWNNISDIEIFYNIKRDKILKCIRGVIKTSNGYIWKCEYKNCALI